MTKEEYTIFSGCLIENRYPTFEFATRFVLNKLEIPYSNCNEFLCCPDPVWIRSLDEKRWLSLAEENLKKAQKMGNPLLVLCNGCYETLNTARILTNNPINVKHIVQLLVEIDWSDKVVKPLNELKIAPHPGCHLTRPSNFSGFDDPINPTFLEKIIERTSAQIVEYPEKNLCCGLPIFSTDKETSLKMAQEKIKNLKNKVDLVLVSCPSCFTQLETAQILDKSEDSKIPIIFVSELVALSMGINPNSLLSNEIHRISLNPVLEKFRG